ncbi:MAG: flavodoxin family protein [Dehalococcoidales bacterium]|jgi:flavodoxin I
MFEVVYLSRRGNTKKVAEAIADELGVTAKDIKALDTLPADAFVFLGAGCYAGVFPAEITRFMNRNKFNGRKIAFFTTSAFGSAAERGWLEKQLKDKGAEITDNFQCFGRWMTLKRNHPDQQDLKNARDFARAVAAKQSPGR